MAFRGGAPPAPSDVRGRVGFPVAGQAGVPARPGQQPAPVGALQIFPPWLYPIDSAVDFQPRADGVALAAGATETPADTVLQLPAGYAGVIRFVSIFVDSPTTALDVSWALRINGGPVPGWNNLRSFPRSANNISITFEGVVQVPQNATIDITIVEHGGALAWTVGASYGGWQWPTAAELELYGRRVSRG